MSEQNFPGEDTPRHTTEILDRETWLPLGPPAPPAYAVQSPRPKRRGTAGILAAALLLGGGAGVGGAAAYDALQEDPVGTQTRATASPVVASTSDTPAPSGSVEAVASSVLPSVVKINVASSQGSGSGSGIIIGSDGLILTNNHVVEGAEGGRMIVNFSDGSSASATIVGTDPLTDLAVIQAADVSGLPVATLNASEDLDVGQEVVAVGSPFGLEATVTSGIISALDRPVSITGAGGSDTTYPAIQTDAAINPGNSGGPLVNMAGEVIGINSSIRTASSGLSQQGGSIGLGFAIPISKVNEIVDQLTNGETATHARMGVTVGNVASQDGLITGAEIGTVESGSAAEEAGIESGDVITRIGTMLVTDSESLVATIRGMRPGDVVPVVLLRDGEEQTVNVTLDSDGGAPSS